MGLADRALALAGRQEVRYSADTWLSEFLLPSMEQFVYGGNTYGAPLGAYGLRQTMVGIRAQEISQSLPGYSAALRQCPPAFAAQMVRALVISQARFTFRNLPSSKTPRKTFGTRALSVLEHPAPSVTTGEMLARMEWHAGLAGNAYVYRQPKRLRVLRPDWVVVIFGSDQEPEDAALALDGELIGFVYCNGGFGSGNKPQTLLPDDVAHWCPLPDPEMSHIGMSWITPAVREIQNDRAASEHKLRYWTQGATPNLVVKGIPALTKPQFDEIVDAMDARHNGVMNAFKTLYLTAGADATVIGNNFKDMDLKNVIAGGETRIAALSRVPAPILGISEGLAGSSLNAGNFGMARRLFADTWVYPTLQDLAGSLADIVDVPSDAELWFDTADMPLLREDAKDAAEILNLKISGVTMAVRDGFTAESSIAAAVAGDVSLLKHSGLTSVQLQPPGTGVEEEDPTADGISAGIDKFLGGGEGTRARFDPADHPRNPKGSAGGGRFRSVAQRVVDALQEWARTDRKGDPFAEFTDREPLRKVATGRGIKLRRGASRDEIAEALKADLLEHFDGKDVPDKPEKVTPAKKAAPKKATLEADLPTVDERLARVNKVAASAPRRMREVVSAELERQAALVPQATGSVRGIRIASESEWDDLRLKGLVDDKVSAAHLLPEHDIVFSPAWRTGRRDLDKRLKHSHQEDHLAWSFPEYDYREVDFASATMRHEFGHVVASRWPLRELRTADGSKVGGEWTAAQRERLLHPLADALHVRRPGPDEDVASWWASSEVEGAARSRISGYAATNLQEALAEIWSVYSGRGDEATPLARKIGAILRDEWSPDRLPFTSIRTPKAAKKAAPKAPDVDLSTLDDPEALRDALDLKKVPELKDMLREAGLPVSGRKRELVDRLVDARAPGKQGKGDAPSVPDAEAKARARQAQIDSKRTVAEGVGEVLELLDNGVSPEGMRKRISASRLDDASKAKLLAGVDADVDNRVRAAYAAVLATKPNQDNRWVGIAELRDELGEGLPRGEVDASLVRLLGEGARLIPEENQKTIKQADRDSAIVVSGEPKHLVSVSNISPKPGSDAAARDLASSAGLTQVGEHGTPLSYDPKQHTFVGDQPRKGQKVAVIRPGYVATVDGEPVVFKAKVETWDDSLHGPPAAKKAAKVTEKPAAPKGKVRLEPAPTVFGNVKEAHDVFLGDANVGTVYVGEDGKMTLFPPRGQRGGGRKIQQPAAGATLDEAVKALTDFHQGESSLTTTDRAHRHIETLVPDFKGNRVLQESRAPIMETLTRQADLVPTTTLSLEGVDYARADADRDGLFGWDFGEQARYDQFSNRITLSPDWHDHYLELSEASQHAHASGWHPPTTHTHGPAASMAHEFGHHVVETMRRNGFDDRQAGELFGTLERALDLEPGTLYDLGQHVDKATINSRLANHSSIIRERISGYAAQPSGDQSSQLDELLAEVWQEYSMMGDKARPHIKEVGAILARLAEEAATR